MEYGLIRHKIDEGIVLNHRFDHFFITN